MGWPSMVVPAEWPGRDRGAQAEDGSTRVDTMTKVLPITTMVLAVGASIVYGWHADWRQCVYWASAAVITASVTF
jgi:hypothetical protein